MTANAFQDARFLAEPYEESQGNRFSPNTPISLDVLNAFYDKMEKRKAEKKLVRGNSLWGRKTHSKSSGNKPQEDNTDTDGVQYVHSPYDALPGPENNQSRVSLGLGEDSSPTIIPDASPEGAAWQTQELEWATLSLIQFRARHPIHNPTGPRWYKNHHIHPPQTQSDQRTPSIFSPSFPPMAASLHTHSQDSTWAPGPSRTPSGSPLPTPDSSQIRISDPQVKVRSRKTSQTAHDEVDLMDGTDPWGQQWHHQSPYDVGLTRQGMESRENMVSKPLNQQNGIPPRTRRASLSAGTGRHKTVAPSPLSQSTSAVHLLSHHPPTIDPSTIGVPRRLSKRRKPFQGLFGDDTQSQPQSATSPANDSPVTLKKQSSKRSSTSGSRPSFITYRPLIRSQTTQGPMEKKEKRGSILGRIVRKLSIVRKSDSVIATNRTSFQPKRQSQPQPAEPADRKSARISTSSPEKNRQSKATVTSQTTTEPETPADSPVPRMSAHAAETRSSISVDIEAPMTLGKLTIANPDAPSTTTTPAKIEEPLPTNDVDTLSQHTLRPTVETPQSPQLAPEPPREPTLPPPRRKSQIRNSIPLVQVQSDPQPEPKMEDDDVPPPVPSKSPFFTRLHLASIPAESVLSLPGVIPTIPTEGTPSVTDSPLGNRFEPHPLPMSPNPPATKLRQRPPSPPTPTRVPPPTNTQELTDDSPLSRASLYVNPGTPYVASSTVKAQAAESFSQRLKNSTSSKSRETETFRLVRSYSGPDPEGQQTFLADGAHWEVENADQKKRDINGPSRPSRHKTPSRETNGEERHQGRKESTDDRHHKRESTRESTDERNQRRESTDERSQRKETAEERHHRRESRRLEGARERDRDREREDRKSRREKSSRDSYLRQEAREKQRSSQVTPTSSSSSAPTRTSMAEAYRRSEYANPTRRSTVSSQQSFPREHDHERKASVSSRPTSEVPSTHMLNDLRAKEMWEMDRIWKGRSMSINQEGSNVIASPMSAGGDLDRREDAHPYPNTHGSGKTYFVVQAPAQSQHPSGQQNGVAFPSGSQPKSNGSHHRAPPPEPMRPAQYQFPPLPQSLRTLDDPASREYWAKLAGVSAATR